MARRSQPCDADAAATAQRSVCKGGRGNGRRTPLTCNPLKDVGYYIARRRTSPIGHIDRDIARKPGRERATRREARGRTKQVHHDIPVATQADWTHHRGNAYRTAFRSCCYTLCPFCCCRCAIHRARRLCPSMRLIPARLCHRRLSALDLLLRLLFAGWCARIRRIRTARRSIRRCF